MYDDFFVLTSRAIPHCDAKSEDTSTREKKLFDKFSSFE
jgi:hypothetical protein